MSSSRLPLEAISVSMYRSNVPSVFTCRVYTWKPLSSLICQHVYKSTSAKNAKTGLICSGVENSKLYFC